ncbi:type VI immunity family protein [Burkholderia gladioli]|uniref:type VI immunity family protein n=1 Tax=Burkholderia gladioli TaxID=28095 RepID=UPI0022B767C3|nr:type VI immunity family protein [Burkholderia gladioli]
MPTWCGVGGSRQTEPAAGLVRQAPYDHGGLIIQAGVRRKPVCWRQGHPPAPPPAYVLLNNALRPIIVDALGTLQTGTATAPRRC